ncbi:MAG: hypothetical protein V4508_15250 [Pseudomonadota bacterium]
MRKFCQSWKFFVPSFFLAASLTACASLPTETTLVIVGKEDFKVFGTSVRTSNELSKILSERKVKKVELRREIDINYEQVGKAIYAVTRSGAEIERIDNMIEK